MKLPLWLIRLRNWPLHRFTHLIIWLVSVLPEQRAYALGGWLGALVYAMQPRWRRTARRNLELFYSRAPAHVRPEAKELAEMGARSARHLGYEVIEFIRMGLLPVDEALRMVVSSEGEKHLRDGLELGKGIVLIGIHYGNWELAGAYIASCIAPMYAVGKAQRDSFFTRLAFPWRQKFGMRNIFAGSQQGSAILRALRENAVLGLISDQNGGKNGVFAPFCGIPASCVTGAAQLVLKTGAPCMAVYTRRLAPGRHHWICTPPFDTSGLPGDQKLAQVEMLTRINAAIESAISADPAQWLLGHKRWKTRPAGEPALYR